jgi:hypothetical protein
MHAHARTHTHVITRENNRAYILEDLWIRKGGIMNVLKVNLR